MAELTKIQQAYALAKELTERQRRRRLYSYYPEDGPLRRELYTKHMAFFEAGADYRERLMLAANRVGKTEGVGGYEVVLHLTGDYPDWWTGRRFDEPVTGWAAGDTSLTVRDIIQHKLLGPPGEFGTGLIPGEKLIDTTSRAGVPNAVQDIMVQHKSGGTSYLTLKSYDQRRESFQGTEKEFIWLDEEPPMDVYGECLIRTMTTNGLILCTFTPLQGMSEVVQSFLPGGKLPDGESKSRKYVIMATWDDAPHLSEQEKQDLWESIPPYQRDARAKGIPQLGAGAIYPIPESDLSCDPFEIPEHWPRIYGLDVGWNRTAAVWAAWDRDSDIVYLYSEHYRGQAEPSIHADAIRARGKWIPGEIDPAARGRGQKDGQQLMSAYLDLGLNVIAAENAREAGIHNVFLRMSTGRLKVFKTLQNWFQEFRLYRRDEKGQVVKEGDHLMDATRYLIMGLQHATIEPPDNPYDDWDEEGRSAIGGY